MEREYHGRFFIRQREWRCGDYLDVDLYPVFQPSGKRREKCRPTREAQQRLNHRDAVKRLERLLRLNFRRNDLEADLTYAEPESEEAAVKDLKKFLRELRRLWRGAGIDLKYVYTVEVGKQSGRVHFHLVLNEGPISRDEVERMWQHGWANTRRLRFDESGLGGLAAYVAKKGAHRTAEEAHRRRWSCSRNLERPKPVVRDAAVSVREVGELAEQIERRDAAEFCRSEWGLELVEAEAVLNGLNHGTYVHLSLAPKEAWNGRPPKAMYISAELGGEAG